MSFYFFCLFSDVFGLIYGRIAQKIEGYSKIYENDIEKNSIV